MKRFTRAAMVAGAALAFSAPAVYASPTLVQFSTGGTGTYDVTGIQQFDWQSSGDLAIRNLLPTLATYTPSATPGCTTGVTNSFQNWAACAQIGNVVSFNVDGHARLNDMLDTGGGSIKPATLDTNGTTGGDTGFEITAAFSGTETAQLTAKGTLTFFGITGSYNFYYDTNPNSDVTSGAGFIDGTAFLSGDLKGVSGTFCNAQLGGNCATSNGNSLLTNTVTAYNANFIQTDPASRQPLIGTTFDTLLKFATPGIEAVVGVGGQIGLAPYIVQNGDLVLKADANSQFSAPEPSTVLLFGIGLMGLAFGMRRKGRLAA